MYLQNATVACRETLAVTHNVRMRSDSVLHPRLALYLPALLLCVSAACMPRGPVLNTGSKTAGVGGTISGTVRGEGASNPLSGRKVTAIDLVSGARFDTTTASGGGYTMQVPVGKYRLEVELRAGETIATRPDDLQIDVSDVDSGRDFVITVRRN
jgi:hypothetical protein